MKKIKFIVILLLFFSFLSFIKAEEVLNDYNTLYFDEVYNAGKDNGYTKKNEIKKDDPHYGWKLGKFIITGFSSKRKDADGNYILLKNVGDDITLYFNLLQNIDALDNNKNLKISSVKNGYDEEFKIKQTDFGKGMLIIRKIDVTQDKSEPILFKDYLKVLKTDENNKVDVFEEGDYEVALDYQLFQDGFAFFNSYNDYRIRFNFSVRNGNCMVYPFDVKTKEELRNTSITENGFYLDLANSKYLNVNIKKEILKDGESGLVEDTRFNKPAKDKEEFTEEGIYTITARNEYTNEVTIKKIYVGKDNLLKAHVQTGRSIDDIKELVNLGASIDDEGIISNIPKDYSKNKSLKSNDSFIVAFVVFTILMIFIAVVLSNKDRIIKSNKKANRKKEVNHEEKNN